MSDISEEIKRYINESENDLVIRVIVSGSSDDASELTTEVGIYDPDIIIELDYYIIRYHIK